MFKSDLQHILNFCVLPNNYPYGKKDTSLSGPQQVHMHLSKSNFDFRNARVQKEYFRYLNFIWVSKYQDTASVEFNPSLAEWLIRAGHLNSISYLNYQVVKPEKLPMELTSLEPEIWNTDEEDYYQGRYCILNFIPSHPFDNDGNYPLHIEYRGLKPILHLKNVEEICTYFKTVANFLMT